MNLKVSGLYNHRIIKQLNELGINSFEFDFRPRSFNFIQKYVLEEIIKEINLGEKIFLHFANEVDFIINDILSVFKESEHRVFLSFSDDQELSFYESFETPFFWHYRADAVSKNILKYKDLAGVVFDLEFLNELSAKGTLLNFYSNFLQITSGRELQMVINIDWDGAISSEILELFSPDFLDVAISNKVEICYRNVDSKKVENSIKFLKNHTC